ncbi:MAG: tail fiber assembly protein [Ruthenibacterium sp.]
MRVNSNIPPAPYEISNITAPLCTVAIAENIHEIITPDSEKSYEYDEWCIQCVYRTDLAAAIDGSLEAWLAAAKAAESAAEAAKVRGKRDALLAASDKYMLSDIPITATKTDWKSYRAALRNVPEQAAFPWAIDWPVMPV